jgi:hypothetical protein
MRNSINLPDDRQSLKNDQNGSTDAHGKVPLEFQDVTPFFPASLSSPPCTVLARGSVDGLQGVKDGGCTQGGAPARLPREDAGLPPRRFQKSWKGVRSQRASAEPPSRSERPRCSRGKGCPKFIPISPPLSLSRNFTLSLSVHTFRTPFRLPASRLGRPWRVSVAPLGLWLCERLESDRSSICCSRGTTRFPCPACSEQDLSRAFRQRW